MKTKLCKLIVLSVVSLMLAGMIISCKEKELFLGENARIFYGFEELIDLPHIKNMSE